MSKSACSHQHEKPTSIKLMLITIEIGGGHAGWQHYSVATNLLASVALPALMVCVI